MFDLLQQLHKKLEHGKELPFKLELLDMLKVQNRKKDGLADELYPEEGPDENDTFNAKTKSIQKEKETISLLEDKGKQLFRQTMTDMGIRHLNILKILLDCYSNEMLKRQLIMENKCVVRLYVLFARNLASRDNGSESDSYLKVCLGEKVFDDRENY